MTRQKLAKELIEFAKMAFVDSMNPETGFLTRNRINPLTNEQITEFSLQTEEIICQMTQHFEIVNSRNVPSDHECGMLFQYVFDKTTEATYKMIMDEEIDTQFIPKEIYDGYAPDLPEYIQLKLTNVVGKVALISSSILQYLDKNKYRTLDMDVWLSAYLMISVTLAIQFAQEIDPDDDSEMQDYLNGIDQRLPISPTPPITKKCYYVFCLRKSLCGLIRLISRICISRMEK